VHSAIDQTLKAKL